ncbi:outer membrane lipoprotein carrier protein LolA [Pseudomonas stutzeri]|uniref:outer membrane lipoprotein carrier protein LolA n=1 Tax=Stutzerimonas stutzeri TaxID=316 RepID=UPI00210A2CE8|nr:outer membrane lipoprotein carrier protein LolA [Stutzerimonas stutzeri]MCQ4312545.1 outer membrane lipoprotein carrier protein LolA [Stutzerimonas stutzeri]
MRLLDRPVGHILLVLSLLLMAGNAHAFDLAQLSRQLNEPAVVRGNFIQEKYLRALPLPLTSRGTFVLARDRGLLWFLQEPLQQDYRISDSGIARRGPSGWQKTDQQGAAARQNDLFLAVLQGDTTALQRDFELELSGTAEAWQLMLTPRSHLLGQIFSAILIRGGATVERIELLETQNDSTVLLLNDNQIDDQLSPTELHDFAD